MKPHEKRLKDLERRIKDERLNLNSYTLGTMEYTRSARRIARYCYERHRLKVEQLSQALGYEVRI